MLHKTQQDSQPRMVPAMWPLGPARIGIWGSSYSGAHVLVVAAIDRRVKAVVSQVPAFGGRARDWFMRHLA